MLIIYEKLDNFLEEIRREAIIGNNKTIYMSILRQQNPETNLLSAQICIQLLQGGNALTYQFTDLPSIRIVHPSYFDSFLNKEESEMAKRNYEKMQKETDEKILEEYNKIKKVIEGYGYKDFKRAMIQ